MIDLRKMQPHPLTLYCRRKAKKYPKTIGVVVGIDWKVVLKKTYFNLIHILAFYAIVKLFQ